MQPPVAKRVPRPVERHGAVVDDDWAWLRDRDDPDVLTYLQAENDYADAWFDDLRPLRDEIFGEIKSRTQETDLSVPVRGATTSTAPSSSPCASATWPPAPTGPT